MSRRDYRHSSDLGCLVAAILAGVIILALIDLIW